MRSIIILILCLEGFFAKAIDTTCLAPNFLHVFDQLKYSEHKDLTFDSALIHDLHVLVELNKSVCLQQLLYDDIVSAELHVSSATFLANFMKDANALLHTAEKHRQVKSLLANVADIRLNELMKRINTGIKEGEIDPKSFEIRYAIQRLAEFKYTISITPSLWKKLFTYLKEGNWDHIGRSICTTHRKPFILYASLFVLAVIITVWGFRSIRKNYQFIIKIQHRNENRL